MLSAEWQETDVQTRGKEHGLRLAHRTTEGLAKSAAGSALGAGPCHHGSLWPTALTRGKGGKETPVYLQLKKHWMVHVVGCLLWERPGLRD